MLHYIVIVAAEDIPKYTELTYDYGSLYIVEGDVSDSPAGVTAWRLLPLPLPPVCLDVQTLMLQPQVTSLFQG